MLAKRANIFVHKIGISVDDAAVNALALYWRFSLDKICYLVIE
jgi:hypothetical protein